ncbi:hypothetical protein EVAR_70097_1 [Eumeta japonica]|uniref:Uncharacterized protein n=1 Tax=Eumeta variegata TaxID=151549 RepID=A0A4C2A5L7_EUMVA|nr:hypothetical protein EVAR_70097_1 [Eumeta japonica]
MNCVNALEQQLPPPPPPAPVDEKHDSLVVLMLLAPGGCDCRQFLRMCLVGMKLINPFGRHRYLATVYELRRHSAYASVPLTTTQGKCAAQRYFSVH